MRTINCTAAVLVLCSASVAPTSAQTIYSNGAPDFVDHWNLNNAHIADDFVITASYDIARVRFWAFEYLGGPPPFRGEVYWSIRSNASGSPGAEVASGLTPASRTLYPQTVRPTYDIFAYEFFTPRLSLGAGHYWLTLHNGPLSDISEGEVALGWATTAANGTLPNRYAYPWASRPDEFNQGNAQMAFELLGPTPDPTVVPEPTSMILLGTGLLAIAGAAKRTRRNITDS